MLKWAADYGFNVMSLYKVNNSSLATLVLGFVSLDQSFCNVNALVRFIGYRD